MVVKGSAKLERSTAQKLLWNHTRVWLGIVLGLLLFCLLPSVWSIIARALAAWNATVLFMLLTTWIKLLSLDARQLRAHYEEEDPTAPLILVAVVAAAVVSVMAIVALLSTVKHMEPATRAAHILLATLTITDCWVLVPTMFTLHYADLFYSADAAHRPLLFPETKEPVFWDFVYFSFTIAAACQTADVATANRGIRRTVVLHSVISFLFNLAILGFAVNVSAGLLGGD